MSGRRERDREIDAVADGEDRSLSPSCNRERDEHSVIFLMRAAISSSFL
jgi:hypothetical protein